MNELITITKTTINNEEVNAVNARELHEKLGVKTQFKDWMPRRIEEFGFEEGKDFSSILSKSHGRPSKEYIISIDMAKELAMVENNSGKTVGKSVYVSGIENVKQKENEHDRISLLARCFNECYRRHSARSVPVFRNIHRCGFFFKNLQEMMLTTEPACAILCVTGLTTRQQAEAAAVTGDDSSEKITFAFLLLGRMGRRNPGVTCCTLSTHSPLFRALTSTGKVTERPHNKEAKNVRPVSGAMPARPPRVSILKSDRRANPADHPRRGEYRPRREEESPELSFRGGRVHEGRLARACRDARSVIKGGEYL